MLSNPTRDSREMRKKAKEIATQRVKVYATFDAIQVAIFNHQQEKVDTLMASLRELTKCG